MVKCYAHDQFRINLFTTLLLSLFTGHLDDNEKLRFIRYYCKITSVTLSDNKESLLPPSAPVSLLSVHVFVLFINTKLCIVHVRACVCVWLYLRHDCYMWLTYSI